MIEKAMPTVTVTRIISVVEFEVIAGSGEVIECCVGELEGVELGDNAVVVGVGLGV